MNSLFSYENEAENAFCEQILSEDDSYSDVSDNGENEMLNFSDHVSRDSSRLFSVSNAFTLSYPKFEGDYEEYPGFDEVSSSGDHFIDFDADQSPYDYNSVNVPLESRIYGQSAPISMECPAGRRKKSLLETMELSTQATHPYPRRFPQNSRSHDAQPYFLHEKPRSFSIITDRDATVSSSRAVMNTFVPTQRFVATSREQHYRIPNSVSNTSTSLPPSENLVLNPGDARSQQLATTHNTENASVPAYRHANVSARHLHSAQLFPPSTPADTFDLRIRAEALAAAMTVALVAATTKSSLPQSHTTSSIRVRFTALREAAYLCPVRKCYIYRPPCPLHVLQEERQRAVRREQRVLVERMAREAKLRERRARAKASRSDSAEEGFAPGGNEDGSGERKPRKPRRAKRVFDDGDEKDDHKTHVGLSQGNIGEAASVDNGQKSTKRKRARPLKANLASVKLHDDATRQADVTTSNTVSVPNCQGKSSGRKASVANDSTGVKTSLVRGTEPTPVDDGVEEEYYTVAGVDAHDVDPWSSLMDSNHVSSVRHDDWVGDMIQDDAARGCQTAREAVDDNIARFETLGSADNTQQEPFIHPTRNDHSFLEDVVAVPSRSCEEYNNSQAVPPSSSKHTTRFLQHSAATDTGASECRPPSLVTNLEDCVHCVANDAMKANKQNSTPTGLVTEKNTPSIPIMPCISRAKSLSLAPRTHGGLTALARISSVLSTLLHALRHGGHTCKRDLYYANPALFSSQRISDAALQLLQAVLHSPRHALGCSAGGRGECEGAAIIDVSESVRVWREDTVVEVEADQGAQGALLSCGRLRGIDAADDEVADGMEEGEESAEQMGLRGVVDVCGRAGWRVVATVAAEALQPPSSENQNEQRNVTKAQISTVPVAETTNFVSGPQTGTTICACQSPIAYTLRECLYEHTIATGSVSFAFARHIPDINPRRRVSEASDEELLEYLGEVPRAGPNSLDFPLEYRTASGKAGPVSAESECRRDQRRMVRTVSRYFIERAVEHRVRCRAQWVLVVEKDTVFRRLVSGKSPNDDSRDASAAPTSDGSQKPTVMTFSQQYGCLVVTGSGYPGVQTRQFLRELANTGTKIVCLVDGDPHGIAIALAYLLGTPNQCLDCPWSLPLRWLGVSARELWSSRDRLSHIVSEREISKSGVTGTEEDDDDGYGDVEDKNEHRSAPWRKWGSISLDLTTRRSLCLPLTEADKRMCAALLRWLDTGERRGLDAGDAATAGLLADAEDDEESDDSDREEEEPEEREANDLEAGEDKSSSLINGVGMKGPRHWDSTAAKLYSELSYMLRHNCKCEIEAISALGPLALRKYVVHKASRFVRGLRQ